MRGRNPGSSDEKKIVQVDARDLHLRPTGPLGGRKGLLFDQ